jgi:hypothetical protein
VQHSKWRARNVEMGHEVPRGRQNAASALPPEAAATVVEWCVRFGPQADSCSAAINLFDHVVGASKHQWRHGETQRLGTLEIDDQFIFRRKLRWQVGGLCALEDAIDI